MLQVCDIDVFYGDAQALDGVSIDVEEGRIVAIVGANGAGKTSLIRTIAGMQRPARVAASGAGSRRSTATSPACASARASSPARCPAASSRWSRSAAA